MPALDQERTCRVCGCTDARTCPGGCYWIEPDLCSHCELDALMRRREAEAKAGA